MAEVLSQNEIDALLAAVSSGNIETDEESRRPNGTDWIAYDITSHEKLVRGRLVALQGIHERFSRYLRTSLSNTLKKNVSVNCTNTDFLRFSDYLANIMLPASLNVVEMSNLKGYMIFVLGSKLTYAMVDAYYGGSERPFSKIGGREEFTAIENSIIQKVCKLAVHEMEQAWKLNFALQLKYERSESNPSFVGSIHTSEMVAVVTFEVELENLSGPLVIVLQVQALEEIHQHLAVNVTTEISADANEWRTHWLRELMETELEVKVELGNATRSLTEISQLKAGDILALQQDSVSALSAYIEGVPKMSGLMGLYRGNAALRITDFAPETATNSTSKKVNQKLKG